MWPAQARYGPLGPLTRPDHLALAGKDTAWR
jgi:hypothetical protein